MATAVRGKIVSVFKLHGLSLKTDASKFLTEVLSPLTEVELEDWLDKIVEGVQKQPLTSSLVDREIAEQAVNECSQTSEDDSDKAFTIIDAFSVPRFTFNPDRKKFLPSSGSVALHSSNPNAKSEVIYKFITSWQKYILVTNRTVWRSNSVESKQTIGALGKKCMRSIAFDFPNLVERRIRVHLLLEWVGGGVAGGFGHFFHSGSFVFVLF